MSIYCWVNVDNYKLVNEVIINKVWSLRDINNEEPTSIDSLFLPASDSVVVSREKQYYGLKYTNGENIQFIPIKQINDSILLLQDGRKFVRIN
jgi:hypothetical protein